MKAKNRSDIDHLTFPSGRSVKRCREDAKALRKRAKEAGQILSHTEALNLVAQQNQMAMPWDKALAKLEKDAGPIASFEIAGLAFELTRGRKTGYITGPPGFGKTTLAFELIRQHINKGLGPVCYVQGASSVHKDGESSEEVSVHCLPSESQGEQSAITYLTVAKDNWYEKVLAQLEAYRYKSNALIVFDEYHRFVNQDGLMMSLASSASGIGVIIVSQEPIDQAYRDTLYKRHGFHFSLGHGGMTEEGFPALYWKPDMDSETGVSVKSGTVDELTERIFSLLRHRNSAAEPLWFGRQVRLLKVMMIALKAKQQELGHLNLGDIRKQLHLERLIALAFDEQLCETKRQPLKDFLFDMPGFPSGQPLPDQIGEQTTRQFYFVSIALAELLYDLSNIYNDDYFDVIDEVNIKLG